MGRIIVVPILLIVAGAHLLKFPPKVINGIIGFKTKAASRSQATWDYANRRAGILLLRIGTVLFVLALLSDLLLPWSDDTLVNVFSYSSIVSMFIVVAVVQLKLLRKFD
ncbi:MAG: SdpI family protein [Alkaliphilus sp.]